MPLLEMKKKAKELIAESDQVVDPLEVLYFDLIQKFQEASKDIKNINEKIIKMPSLQEYLKQNILSKKVSPPWKKVLVQMFSKVIDLGIALADAFVSGARVVYLYTLEPLIKLFQGDVQKKIQMIEQGK